MYRSRIWVVSHQTYLSRRFVAIAHFSWLSFPPTPTTKWHWLPLSQLFRSHIGSPKVECHACSLFFLVKCNPAALCSWLFISSIFPSETLNCISCSDAELINYKCPLLKMWRFWQVIQLITNARLCQAEPVFSGCKKVDQPRMWKIHRQVWWAEIRGSTPYYVLRS